MQVTQVIPHLQIEVVVIATRVAKRVQVQKLVQEQKLVQMVNQNQAVAVIGPGYPNLNWPYILWLGKTFP